MAQQDGHRGGHDVQCQAIGLQGHFVLPLPLLDSAQIGKQHGVARVGRVEPEGMADIVLCLRQTVSFDGGGNPFAPLVIRGLCPKRRACETA